MTKFFDKIQIEGCKIQIGEVNNVLVECPYNPDFDLEKYFLDNFLPKNKDKNIYFLAGVNSEVSGRASDKDVIKINHIAFDFDNLLPGQENILLDNLKKSYLNGFNFALHSGGGVHIYYFFDSTTFNYKNFAKKMKLMCLEIEDKSGFEVDKACINAGRIMRLPLSFNAKRGIETKILFEQWNEYLNIPEIFKNLKEPEPTPPPTIQVHSEGSVDDVINSIPVEELMIKLMSEIHGVRLDFKKDNGHFVDGSGKAKAFFKGRDKNCIIPGGSDWLSGAQNYGCFGLVREMLNLDSNGAYDWFKANFDAVSDANDKARDDWKADQSIGGSYDDMPGNKEPEVSSKSFIPLKLSDIVNKEFGEYKYIVENFIPREGITIIGGAPKSGKSWICLHIMNCIASGTDVFEKKTHKAKMLVIDEENSLRGLKRRVLKSFKDVDELPIAVVSQQNFKIDRKEDRKWLIEYMNEEGIELLVFDSFRRISTKDENESKSIAELYENFKEVMMGTGCGILLIHHNRKVSKGEVIGFESFRGSGDISAMAEAMIVVSSKKLENMAGKQTTVIPELRESPDTNAFIVDWYDDVDGNIVFEYKGEIEEGETKLEEAIGIVRKFFLDKTGEYSRDMLKIEFGDTVSKHNLIDAPENLVETGYLKKKIGARSKVFYSLNEVPDFTEK